MLTNILKLSCLLIYVLALAALAGLLPPAYTEPCINLAGLLLIIHALEAVAVFKHLGKYRGPMWMSLLLTILFGVLHWQPLLKLKSVKE
ncbi:MAG: hypothetical protein WA071_09875 [Undibacterium umbellatum]|uniref:hypothetical protein n=1 Tax=Undibacterium umbellatum TaxID=2762300 RepID=UPI003BB5468D